MCRGERVEESMTGGGMVVVVVVVVGVWREKDFGGGS